VTNPQLTPYTRATATELLRIRPPVQRVFRQTLHAFDVHGVTIPAGWTVMLCNGVATQHLAQSLTPSTSYPTHLLPSFLHTQGLSLSLTHTHTHTYTHTHTSKQSRYQVHRQSTSIMWPYFKLGCGPRCAQIEAYNVVRDPTEFKPERWLDVKALPEGYMPFGHGARVRMTAPFPLNCTSWRHGRKSWSVRIAANYVTSENIH
jgi:hypothetical protein